MDARAVDRSIVDLAFRGREVDPLEHAGARRFLIQTPCKHPAAHVDEQDLARLDVTDLLVAQEAERNALGGQHMGLAAVERAFGSSRAPAPDERPDPVRIPESHQALIGDHRDDAVAAVDLAEDARDGLADVLELGLAVGGNSRKLAGFGALGRAHQAFGQEIENHLGVRMGQQPAVHPVLQLRGELRAVDDVSVVDHPQAEWIAQDEGLDVAQIALTDRAVAGMADRHIPGQMGHVLAGEDGFDQPKVLDPVEPVGIIGKDAGGVLSAMLERGQSKKGFASGIRGADESNDSAHRCSLPIARLGQRFSDLFAPILGSK